MAANADPEADPLGPPDPPTARSVHALVEVGHQATEEAGMRYVVDWIDRRLRSLVGEIPVVHIPAGDPFFHV